MNMGLYNMVFGNSAQAPLVLHLLDRSPGDFGRYRDAWVEKNDAGELRLAVYTRCGGGNREGYGEMFDAMYEHPLYMSDDDDDYDCTYATLFFRVPEDAESRIRKLAADAGAEVPAEWKLADIAQDTVNMGERWTRAIAAIGNPA